MFKRIGSKLGLIAALTGVLGAGAAGVALADTATGDGPDGGGMRARILQKYDTNGDGKLDDGERAAMRADFQAKREARRAKMLAEYDTNKDGKLEPSERAAMRADRAAKEFKRLDTNGDGVISPDEFAAGFHGKRGGFGGFHGRGPRGGGGGEPG